MPEAKVGARPVEYMMQTNGNTVQAANRYFVNGVIVAASANVRWIVTRTVTIDRIYARLSGACGAGETTVFMLMVNGVASGVTVTIGGAVQVNNNSFANGVVLVAGDEINIRVEASAGANVGSPSCTVGGYY